ncbi:MAG: stage V sporulation protein T, partial [Clostridia bacterium]|nr:stage V sporulation protein T [Clostridia bacterium]
CDTDEVLHAAGRGQRVFDGKSLSEKMEKIMLGRKSYVANLSEGGDVVPITNDGDAGVTAQIIVPIVCNGDCLGAVALVSTEQGAKIEAGACKLAQLSATILANQFE